MEEGIAFGLFSFDDTKLYNILTILILIIIFIIVFMISKSIGLKISTFNDFRGALGNFFDRLVYKAVRFFRFPY